MGKQQLSLISNAQREERDENIDNAIKIIQDNFLWSNTPQGYSYWLNVVENLQKVKEVNP